jgi:16S rRNA (uracil1498-N3)-methyltransferase
MARRYRVTPLPADRAWLRGDVAHHLRAVMRTRVGDTIVLFDGAGDECPAEVLAVEPDGVLVRCGPAAPSAREPERAVELAFALPRGARAEWLFEHATEVGAAAFRPIVSQRSLGSGRRERWERIVAAAAGQCDRARVPPVFAPEPLVALLARADLPGERWLAAPGGEPLRAAGGRAALLLVGPEGGFTAPETAAIAAAGFRSGSLGPLTLRTETAALAGLVRLLA